MSTFLRSPRAYYWRYIQGVEPATPSVTTFDEAKLWGQIWAAHVDRFYRGVPEGKNQATTMQTWLDGSEGWVPAKKRDGLTKSLETLGPQYYQQFDPADGVRSAGSELKVEDDCFLGILDGLSTDGVVHEVKTTSRSPQLSEQLWKVQHSLQVRLYCVLAKAEGVCVEFGFKDSPSQLYRGPVLTVTKEERTRWERELRALAEAIRGFGDDPDHYPCHTDNCCLTTRGYVSMCPYQLLCEQGKNETTEIFYKERQHRG